jgi:hypothetical protein
MCVIGALLQLLLGSLDGSRSLFPPPAAVSVALGLVKKVVCYVEPSIAWESCKTASIPAWLRRRLDTRKASGHVLGLASKKMQMQPPEP